MTEYALYLESGPKRRKTMVHVLQLLGCNANGPTTEEALAATPDAIRTYLRFLKRCGERADPEEDVTTAVAEHVTEGSWLGNGSPYLMFGPDYEAVPTAEIETLTHRFHVLREELASWTESQPGAALDAKPANGGRTAGAVLLHVMGTPPAYVSPVVGGVPGASRVVTAAERGEISLAAGLREVEAIVSQRIRETTTEQRNAVIERGQMVRTLRKAIRRTLEHDWEHLAELSRRPGGPIV